VIPRGSAGSDDGFVTEHYDVIIVGSGAGGGTLARNCKAYELDNLYVVDTSIFPSIGAVNPALTAMANAIRVGEHLLSRLS
jgi:choline dehydrogenase-like flavoprotein